MAPDCISNKNHNNHEKTCPRERSKIIFTKNLLGCLKPWGRAVNTEGQGHQPPLTIFGSENRNIELDKKEGVEKKWHRKENVKPKKWCLPQKFVYVLFSVLNLFSLVSREALVILHITPSNKKNTFNSLSMYLR